MIVLDTHALLWMDRDDSSLGVAARRRIEIAWGSEGVVVSAISFWEAAMLAQRGRIVLPADIHLWRSDLLMAGIQEEPIDGRIALMAVSLQDLHRDPADRFIIATALIHNGALITADEKMLAWPGQLTRQDARV